MPSPARRAAAPGCPGLPICALLGRMRFAFEPIGFIRSPYPDRFGIPRQPGLVTAAEGRLELLPAFAREEAFKGIEGFSHVWLLFVFHDDCLEAGWRPTVRPPRLGGRQSVGVFASRAPYRPNPIGLSVLEHLGLERTGGGLALRLKGIDLLDGTPVLDIKPYLPHVDARPGARGGFAAAAAEHRCEVAFAAVAEHQVAEADPDGTRRLRRLIAQVLEQDPRPGYMDRYPQRSEFAMRLFDLEVRWHVGARRATVLSVLPYCER